MCAEDDDTLWIAEYYDEMTGMKMNPALVMQARKEEIDEYHKHQVYKKVPIKKCIEETGKQPIGIRWVYVNKGDENTPEYRARLVAKEIKKDKRLDMFAATPPLEAKKLLFTFATTRGIGWKNDKRNENRFY